MKVYRILADFVFWFHWVWISLLLGGTVLSRKYKWYKRYHVVVMTSTVFSQLIFLGCPLVALENTLRMQYNPEAKFSGSFICHYLKEYFGFQISPEHITLVLVGIVAISALIFLRRPKEQEET